MIHYTCPQEKTVDQLITLLAFNADAQHGDKLAQTIRKNITVERCQLLLER